MAGAFSRGIVVDTWVAQKEDTEECFLTEKQKWAWCLGQHCDQEQFAESIKLQLFQDDSTSDCEEVNQDEDECDIDIFVPNTSDAIPVPSPSQGHSPPQHGTPANDSIISEAHRCSTKPGRQSSSDPCFDTFVTDPCFSQLASRKSVTVPHHLSRAGSIPSHSETSRRLCDSDNSTVSAPSVTQSFASTSSNVSSTGKQTTSWPKLTKTVNSTASSGYFSSCGSKNASTRTNAPSPRVVMSQNYKYDAFVAYSRHDSDWAVSLSNKLEDEDFQTFLYERDRILGRIFIKDMAQQIHNSHKVICLLSANFLNSSWCMDDLHRAMFEQTSRGSHDKFLIILRLDQCEIPHELQHLNWVDCGGCQDGPTDDIADKVITAIRDGVD